jgi:LPXTG-motif cell wall-anchored protein
MRKLAQDRGGTRRIRVVLSRSMTIALAVGVIATVLSAVPATVSAAGQVGCGGKPGSPDRAALLQYCPKTARSTSPDGTATPAAPQSSISTPGSGSAQHKHAAAKGDDPQLPLTNYPSTGGINLMLVLLIVFALALAIAYGARRWRRSRAQAS